MPERKFFIALVGIILALMAIVAVADKHYDTLAYQQGRRAALTGLDPHVNPYRGTSRGYRWLDGYLDVDGFPDP